MVFPMLLAPTAPGAPRLARADLGAERWRLFHACYRFNFTWVPRLVWSEDTAAGVPFARRAALALLARGNVPWWNTLLTLHS
jgi:hypothetical protein